MFGFKFFRKDEESSVLAVDIDMMIVDGMSTELLIHQVMQYYNGEAVEPTIEVCFSDYMELEKQKREKMEAVDKEFWMQNIQNFTAGTKGCTGYSILLFLRKCNRGRKMECRRKEIA